MLGADGLSSTTDAGEPGANYTRWLDCERMRSNRWFSADVNSDISSSPEFRSH